MLLNLLIQEAQSMGYTVSIIDDDIILLDGVEHVYHTLLAEINHRKTLQMITTKLKECQNQGIELAYDYNEYTGYHQINQDFYDDYGALSFFCEKLNPSPKYLSKRPHKIFNHKAIQENLFLDKLVIDSINKELDSIESININVIPTKSQSLDEISKGDKGALINRPTETQSLIKSNRLNLPLRFDKGRLYEVYYPARGSWVKAVFMNYVTMLFDNEMALVGLNFEFRGESFRISRADDIKIGFTDNSSFKRQTPFNSKGYKSKVNQKKDKDITEVKQKVKCNNKSKIDNKKTPIESASLLPGF